MLKISKWTISQIHTHLHIKFELTANIRYRSTTHTNPWTTLRHHPGHSGALALTVIFGFSSSSSGASSVSSCNSKLQPFSCNSRKIFRWQKNCSRQKKLCQEEFTLTTSVWSSSPPSCKGKRKIITCVKNHSTNILVT